jgi:hypothetical protein
MACCAWTDEETSGSSIFAVIRIGAITTNLHRGPSSHPTNVEWGTESRVRFLHGGCGTQVGQEFAVRRGFNEGFTEF